MNSLDRNLLNANRRETLAMATRPAILLLPLLLENDNLVGAVTFENRGFNLGIWQGSARLDVCRKVCLGVGN